MPHSLDNTIALLERTPSTLNALLRGMPEIWTSGNEGGDTWTPGYVVGHLISGERTDWMPRVKLILQPGDIKTFQRFDMTGHLREVEGKSLAELLDEFASLRNVNLRELRALNLSPQDLERRGQHPSLGPVNLSQLLATWPVHDMTHLHQLSRILARQYQEEVGPWAQYLGVLQCAGHSSR